MLTNILGSEQKLGFIDAAVAIHTPIKLQTCLDNIGKCLIYDHALGKNFTDQVRRHKKEMPGVVRQIKLKHGLDVD